ncbi:MAG: hypothetical protein EAZ07_07195 [Cytophagales bacterium]|nr:MAG: hypothetical protein EAZ07_07195 [Cytophagales bacterium]
MNNYCTILYHEWLAYWRSPLWASNILSLFFNILGTIIIFVSVPFVGYYFGDVIFQINPSIGIEPIKIVCYYIPHFFLISTVFLAMSIKTASNCPNIYLLMPKMRNTIVWYLMNNHLFHKFQRLFLLFIIPFAYHYIYPQYGLIKSGIIVLGYIELQLCATLVLILLKNLSLKSWLISLLSIFILLIAIISIRLEWISTISIGVYIFEKIQSIDLLFHLTLFISTILLFDKNYQLIFRNFTKEDISDKTIDQKNKIGFSVIEKIPINIMVIIRLIGIDNIKRPNFIFSILSYFIFMGILCFAPSFFADTSTMIMYFQILASSLIINILPSFFPLLSSYMDGLCSSKTDLFRLLKTQYRLIIIFYFSMLLLCFPVIYKYYSNWQLIIALSIFHGGITSCIYILNSYFFAGRVEIGNKKSKIGGGKMIGGSILALMGIWLCSLFIYSVVGKVLGKNYSYYIFTTIGGFFILSHPIWLKEIITHFLKNKYQKLNNYRIT